MDIDTKPGFQVLSSINSDLKIRDYKKQRHHRKSRSGCLPCKEKKVKVCTFSLISLLVLYHVSVTRTSQCAYDVDETGELVYMAGPMRASMNITLWRALRLQSSLQSAQSLLYTPVRKMEPLVFNSCIISVQTGMPYSACRVVTS